jgi:alpha-tubulin suppressor-like RCC1 family protein
VVRGTAFVIGLVVFDVGCAMVADLGDPKTLGTTDQTGPLGGDAGGDAQAPLGEAGDAGDGGESGAGSTLQAVTIAVGATHACAVVRDAPGSPENGTMRCWGANDTGELGNDPATVTSSFTPVEVAGRGQVEQSGAASLTLASGYSCTITTDGYLLCWGAVPAVGGVTRADSTLAYEPSQMDINIRPLADVASASITDVGGCCTLVDRSLICWGQDLAPTAPDGGVTALDSGIDVGDEFDEVSVGRAHACGIAATQSSSTRDVECWGANTHGQTGLPFSTVVSHPNHLGLGAKGNLLAVAAGGDDSCALFESGALYCWGANDRGQLGTGSAGVDSQLPLPVSFANVSSSAVPFAVAVGDGHACAVLNDRSVWCWGDNSASQLGGGPGGPSFSAEPTRVRWASNHLLSDVESIAAGGRTTCAILINDPRVWCWGANDQGQSGQPPGNPVAYATPVAW